MRLNSIKLPHFNRAAESRSTELRLPPKVIISMSQHGGVPCKPVVQVGDDVKTGQLIGDSDAVMSAPIYSSVTGKVTGKTEIINIFGKIHEALIIETVPNQVMSEDIAPPVINSREDLIAAVKKSGLVGLGGAGFPTHIKLSYDLKINEVDTLIVNGAECEPYITSDYRTFIEDGDRVIEGMLLIMKHLNIPKAVIGIESDKPEAVMNMTKLAERYDNITVSALPPRYPQGAEKVLVYNITGRTIGKGQFPVSVGCLVLNCSTIAFIGEYARTGIPLIKRRITVDGSIVNKPRNIIVPIGTRASDVVAAADVRVLPDRAYMGGPMMGQTFYDPDTPIMKYTNALLLFAETKENVQTACIRCGRCVSACSMGLVPTDIEHAFDKKDIEWLKQLHVELCMNCGACSYVCPAKRNISEKNQLAKLFLRENKQKK